MWKLSRSVESPGMDGVRRIVKSISQVFSPRPRTRVIQLRTSAPFNSVNHDDTDGDYSLSLMELRRVFHIPRKTVAFARLVERKRRAGSLLKGSVSDSVCSLVFFNYSPSLVAVVESTGWLCYTVGSPLLMDRVLK